MKLKHSAVKSSVFALVTTLEFDLEVGDHFLPTRVELFRDTERTWELSDRFEDFEARNAKEALKAFLNSLKAYLKRVAG